MNVFPPSSFFVWFGALVAACLRGCSHVSRHGLKATLQSQFGNLPLCRLLGLLEARLQLEGSWPFFSGKTAVSIRSFGISSVVDKIETNVRYHSGKWQVILALINTQLLYIGVTSSILIGYKHAANSCLLCFSYVIPTNNKQLLDEVEHDSENYQGRGLCYLPKPKAEADNTNRGLDNFAIMRKPNPIIVLLYNYKCRSVETFHRTTTK